MELSEKQRQYFFKGGVKLQLSSTSTHKRLQQTIAALDKKNLSETENFTHTYTSTFDLVKGDNNLTHLILEFIIENGLCSQVREITGLDFGLGDFTFRKTYSNKSYMNWHRDTYLDSSGTLIGRVPPLIKIIYYPQLSTSCSPCLKFAPGTHRRIFTNSFVDRFQYIVSKTEAIFPSNEDMFMFDSSILHSAAAADPNSGAFRLIMNFCHSSHRPYFRNGEFVQRIFDEKAKMSSKIAI